ncbi:MAG: hypothetical protein ABR973_15525 [Candidatus Acidiferrales bacterium]|jgi:hypothetical protein
MNPAFERYVGIDYSGAQTPTSSLKGVRVYAADCLTGPHEVKPPRSPRKHWTRRGVAEWLTERLSEGPRTLAGIDHGFSFPLRYFEQRELPLDWPSFLDDFQRHWPTDEDIYVDFVREGIAGNAAARSGNSRWRRVTEVRARKAKSVFHFDVQGSVAKSTHAGIPWLRYIRRKAKDRVHFWPFDGWNVPPDRSVVAEIYPALWIRTFPSLGRTPDQQAAYAAAEWLRRADCDGSLEKFLRPKLEPHERKAAEIEGWILGVL